jgi:hypothetical protein
MEQSKQFPASQPEILRDQFGKTIASLQTLNDTVKYEFGEAAKVGRVLNTVRGSEVVFRNSNGRTAVSRMER